MSPVPTVPPSFYHLMTGAGIPLTLQTNVTVSVSLIVWSLGALTNLTGTKNDNANVSLVKYLTRES